MSERFRRKYPVNLTEMSWRHPHEKPQEDDTFLGAFAAIEADEYFYRYGDVVWYDDDWLIDEDMFDDEPDLRYGLIAWMPFPELPGNKGGKDAS